MSYLEELLSEFRKGAKIRRKDWADKNAFIHKVGDDMVDKDGDRYFFIMPDIMKDVWELYQEPIDWDYIIKNKCLCWFWNDTEAFKRYGHLSNYSCGIYVKDGMFEYKNCRPVRRDEVTFYEAREDD